MAKEKDVVNLELSEGLIRPILEAKIQSAIIEGLAADSDKIIGEIVANALNREVNASTGGATFASYDKTCSYMEYLSRDFIMEMAREALMEHFSQQRDKIKAAMAKALGRSGNKFVKAMVDAAEQSITCKWNPKLTIDFDRQAQD